MAKPSVSTRCVANAHTAANERIVEFSSSVGGGLISFREVDGRLIVDVYRCDDTVTVRSNEADRLRAELAALKGGSDGR